ncbi:MAG: hypothetical protein HQK65_19345 [Desulfamplus sp.]|nr:hypothetical protein [Desulfamplus sp.]
MYAVEFETRNKGRFIELPLSGDLNEEIYMKVIVISSRDLGQLMQKKIPDRAVELETLFNDAKKIEIDKKIDISQLCNEVNK